MKNLLFLLAFLSLGFTAGAQNKHAFYDEVQTIKTYDKQFKPLQNPILFVGSSSIRKWDSLQVVFGSYNVINRGIGGAVIDDILFYLDDIVFPYNPRQIILYVGENDVPNEKESADTILRKTIRLYRAIRARLPQTPIVYLSFKPSPSRDAFKGKAVEATRLIRDFLATEKNADFVDVYSPMLSKEGESRPELFVADRLHMNNQGYAIWEKQLKKHLLKPAKR